eukprot:s440_g7.t1
MSKTSSNEVPYRRRTFTWQGEVRVIREGFEVFFVRTKSVLMVRMYPSRFPRRDLPDVALLFSESLNKEIAELTPGDWVEFEATMTLHGYRGDPELMTLWHIKRVEPPTPLSSSAGRGGPMSGRAELNMAEGKRPAEAEAIPVESEVKKPEPEVKDSQPQESPQQVAEAEPQKETEKETQAPEVEAAPEQPAEAQPETTLQGSCLTEGPNPGILACHLWRVSEDASLVTLVGLQRWLVAGWPKQHPLRRPLHCKRQHGQSPLCFHQVQMPVTAVRLSAHRPEWQPWYVHDDLQEWQEILKAAFMEHV